MNAPSTPDASRRDFLRAAGVGAAYVMTAGAARSAVPSANLLPQRELGPTGVRVPVIGLGTAPLGHRPRKEAAEFVSACIDAGLTYIDTAPEFAGYGCAQLAVGDVLKKRRQEVFLVTKCWEPDGEAALKLLKDNLHELQTDHADLVYGHSIGSDKMDPKIVMGKNGVMRALEKARQDGLLRFIGISGHNRPARFLDVLRDFDVQVMMNAVNFVARHIYNFEETVWPEAHRRGVALVAMKIYGGGTEPHGGRMHGADVPAAFRYAHSLPHVSTVVTGIRDRQELDENLQMLRSFMPLSADESQQLLARGKDLAKEWGEVYGPVV